MEIYEKDARGMMRLEGSVEQMIYSNEDTGYAVCDLAIDEEIVTACGIMPMISEGDRLVCYGRWVHNAKYGRQFSVEQYERTMPSDTASMLRYLSSRTIKGIGPKTAIKIIQAFGDEAFDVIENHPEWLTEIKGVSMKVALAASESFKEQTGIRSAMMFFRDHFGPATTVRIYKRWGKEAVNVAKKNPYRLCNEIEGIGFERADVLARSLGMRTDSLDRIMSGLYYVLGRNSVSSGHVCLPRNMLSEAAAEVLGVALDDADSAISELIRMGKFKYVLRDEVQMIYAAEAYDEEKYIAEKLILLDKTCAAVDVSDVDRFIEREEAASGIRYASLQKQAISDALRYGVTILTGGPGTGKTTVVRALIRIFESMGYDIALAAPTGRAAKRMSEATSNEAKTIHRLLEMSYSEDGRAEFCKGEHDLLDEQVIIVDEASMIDSSLMCALLKAIKPGARFIIIGDYDQLPSVGAGNVLRDVIESERFSTVRLTEIFRQAKESLIVTNAHAINRGEMPDISVKDNDFFFLRRGSDREIAAAVTELCQNRLPRAYGELARNGIQVVCASRKGEAGTENLNVMLQRSINPPSKDKREYVFRERVFRENDRVMQTRNNYDIEWVRSYDGKMGSGIFNGDIGIIEEIDVHQSEMTILFDDRRVVYDLSLLDDIEHAYAITVHKSQGSEYPIVVIPMCSAPQMLHTRNLLYTAVTRAQSMVVMVGREDIIAEMVKNDRQAMRYTGLFERLGGKNDAT